MVEGDREAFARRRRDDHVICNAEFGEIGPCAKGIVLARPDMHAEDIARTEPGRKGLELMDRGVREDVHRSEEHTSELQSLMRISYAVFCLKKKKKQSQTKQPHIVYHTYNSACTTSQTPTKSNSHT